MPAPSPRRRTEGIVVETIGGETLVYDVRRHRAHALEATAAAIWRACDGRTSVAEIARRAARSPVALPESVVWLTLQKLEKAELLEAEVTPPPGRGRASRRALLRLAATIGGLSVLTVAVPTPAYALTCIPEGQCGNGGTNNQCVDRDGRRCCSGLCEQQGQTCGVGQFGRRCT